MQHMMTSRRVWRITGLFVAFTMVAALAVWLAGTVRAGQLLPFDEPVMRWLHAQANDLLTIVLLAITQLGGVLGVTLMTCGLVLWLLKNKHTYRAWFVALTVAGAGLLNVCLKLLFARERPDFWQHVVHESSYSFPSGHAMGSSALVFAVIFLLWKTKWRWWSVASGVLAIVLVGISRMYLGVHYPSDIVAGWIVSLVWTSLVYGVLYGYTKRKQKRGGSGQNEQTSGN